MANKITSNVFLFNSFSLSLSFPLSLSHSLFLSAFVCITINRLISVSIQLRYAESLLGKNSMHALDIVLCIGSVTNFPINYIPRRQKENKNCQTFNFIIDIESTPDSEIEHPFSLQLLIFWCVLCALFKMFRYSRFNSFQNARIISIGRTTMTH